eukprot:TRINITY_DN37773_c0_g1_i1.p1 TRINITY_DN37773_c0_g1~~TRINITY_DN37773_c0_g1_i1.p1  ORF type:complete len:185 (+),score=22.24 TRINITY_DN37773_c0_g1_i1:57-557(+)
MNTIAEVLLTMLVSGICCFAFGLWQIHEAGNWNKGTSQQECLVMEHSKSKRCDIKCNGEGSCHGRNFIYTVLVETGACVSRNETYTWKSSRCTYSPEYVAGVLTPCQVRADCSSLDLVLPSEHKSLGVTLTVIGAVLLSPFVCFVLCILIQMFVASPEGWELLNVN